MDKNKKKPIGLEPAGGMSERLEVASRILQGLLPLSGNAIIIDSDKTIHWFSRLAYRYADELLKNETVHVDDIPEAPPAFPPQATLMPAHSILKRSGN